MQSLRLAVIGICAACLIGSMFFHMLHNGKLQKTAALPLRLFFLLVVISAVIPIKAEMFSLNLPDTIPKSHNIQQQYDNQIMIIFEKNLTEKLQQHLLTMEVTADKILPEYNTDNNNRITITNTTLYLQQEYKSKADNIQKVIGELTGGECRIIWEERK